MNDNQDKFYANFYALFDQLNEYRENKDRFMNVLSTIKQLLKVYINSSDSKTDILTPKLVTLEQHLDNKVIQTLSNERILDNISYYISYIRKNRDTSNKRLLIPIKPGVDLAFEQYPRLADIGTEEQYSLYLETIFPESKIKDIVYHRTGEKFDVFDTSKIKETNGNRFYFSPINTGRYGNHAIQAILNIKNLAVPYSNNFMNDVNKRHPEYTRGKSKYFHLPAQIYINADKYGYDGVYAFEGTNDDEYSVYLPEQIHILGSKQDIEGFKRFVGE